MDIKEKRIFDQSKLVWEENLRLFPKSRLHYPDENLVRIFSGKYCKIPQAPAKVLDHGFGHGNNLRFLYGKGYQCYGCEISDHLIDEVNQIFNKDHKTVSLEAIQGSSLPYSDAEFDIVVSWNSLHYNGTRDVVDQVVREFNRILVPGGVLILSTLHPKSGFYHRMRHLGNHSYLIEEKNQYDNRDGLVFFGAQSDDEMQDIFSQFSDIKIGCVEVDLFNSKNKDAWYIVYAVR